MEKLLILKGMKKMIDCSKTESYFAEKRRMTNKPKFGLCGIKCADCPLSDTNNDTNIGCAAFEMLCPEKAIAVVQKWSNAHPQKTFLSELLKNYPNTPPGDDGTPNFCPYRLGLMNIDDCREDHNCAKCWNQPIKEGEE